MEPLAHTLVGACLGETGLKRRTPLAMAALVIGSMLPDVEGVCYLAGSDVAFHYRRGITHGILAIIILPLALTGLLLLYDRLWRRRRDRGAPPAHAGWLLALAFIGVATHPLLDWMNNYGVRLLMPFSGRWFYGDALFIVDPWLWLIAGSAVILIVQPSRRLSIAWIAVGLATGAIMLTSALVPGGARVAWFGLGAMLVALRLTRRSPARPQLAVASVGLTAAYMILMFAGSRVAESQVRSLAARQGWTLSDAVAVPAPANPFQRYVIAVTSDRYLFVQCALAGRS